MTVSNPNSSLPRRMLTHIMDGGTLTRRDARELMQRVMRGDVDEALFGAIFATLHMRGETTDELTGFALAMREAAISVPHVAGSIDTCGTGGSGTNTCNISTISALVAAGAGAVVAKHGNRAVSSSCGSADVLEALDVELATTPEVVTGQLQRSRFSFMFAPAFHPAMRHAAAPRSALGIRTAFNLLGPLANPAQVRRQVLGVSDRARLRQIAEVLCELGVQRALVVHGEGGVDELSIAGASMICDVADGTITQRELTPVEVGLSQAPLAEVRGGDIARNVQIARGVLDGRPGPVRDMVVLNAGAALLVADVVDDMAAGVRAAQRAIDSGSARAVLASAIEHRGGTAPVLEQVV